MSPSPDNTESEWLAQYAAMRKLLAELRVEALTDGSKGYGHKIVLEEEDLTGSSGSDDLWSFFGNEEQDAGYNSDEFDDVTDSPIDTSKSVYPYGQRWLRSKCLAFVSSKPGMVAEELQQKLSAMLASDMRGLQARFLLLLEID